MRKPFYILMFLLCSLPALCAVPVTGNLKDIATGAVTSGTFLRFELTRCGANIPRITGTSVIVSKVKDFRPNASGAISGTLYGNDEIECGGVADNSCYDMSVYYNNTRQSTVPVKVYAPGFNLNSFAVATTCGTSTPIAPPATPQGYLYQTPTGDQNVNQPAGTNFLLSHDPTVAMGAATKSYVDASITASITAGLAGYATTDWVTSVIAETGSSVEVWAESDVQTAIGLLPAAGGTVRLLPNHEYAITCGANQINTGSKVVRIAGSGETSIISGSGCALVTLASSGSKIEDMTVKQTAANASTVGVFVGTGTTTEVTRWVIEDVYFESTDKFAGSAIKTRFGLEGVVRGGETRGWGCGVELTGYDTGHRSNANHFDGVKVRWGTKGFCIPANAIDNVFIDGATIEGHSGPGIDASSGTIYLAKSHLEQNGSATDAMVELKVDARIVSQGVFYGRSPVVSNLDIRVASGNTSPQVSYGDILNDGITHAGTALFTVHDKIINYTSTGTGTVVDYSGSQTIASDADWAFVFGGFAWFDVRMPIVNTTGDTKIAASDGNKVSIQDTTGTNKAAEFNPATKTSYLFGPVVVSGATTMGKGLCLGANKKLGYCSTVLDASGNCTCNEY